MLENQPHVKVVAVLFLVLRSKCLVTHFLISIKIIPLGILRHICSEVVLIISLQPVTQARMATEHGVNLLVGNKKKQNK
jgi:hypothetical protein